MSQLFEPDYGSTLTLSVSTSSDLEEFIGQGGSILIFNAHDQLVWVKTGKAAGLEATQGADLPVPPGRQTLVRLPRTHTHIAAVSASGSGTVYVTRGDGI